MIEKGISKPKNNKVPVKNHLLFRKFIKAIAERFYWFVMIMIINGTMKMSSLIEIMMSNGQ